MTDHRDTIRLHVEKAGEASTPAGAASHSLAAHIEAMILIADTIRDVGAALILAIRPARPRPGDQ